LGWWTEPEGGTQVTYVTEVTDEATRTLYAKWSLVGQRVTFDANGGKIAKNATQNFYHGKTGQKFADTGATNGKKTLLGWALTADAKEARYKVNSGVIDSWILNNRPKITLYAVWK
jgi:hypothetical protein